MGTLVHFTIFLLWTSARP